MTGVRSLLTLWFLEALDVTGLSWLTCQWQWECLCVSVVWSVLYYTSFEGLRHCAAEESLNWMAFIPGEKSMCIEFSENLKQIFFSHYYYYAYEVKSKFFS